MPESPQDTEVEEVLAAIRRLIVDGPGRGRPASSPVPPAPFLLTPALRVDPPGVSGTLEPPAPPPEPLVLRAARVPDPPLPEALRAPPEPLVLRAEPLDAAVEPRIRIEPLVLRADPLPEPPEPPLAAPPMPDALTDDTAPSEPLLLHPAKPEPLVLRDALPEPLVLRIAPPALPADASQPLPEPLPDEASPAPGSDASDLVASPPVLPEDDPIGEIQLLAGMTADNDRPAVPADGPEAKQPRDAAAEEPFPAVSAAPQLEAFTAVGPSPETDADGEAGASAGADAPPAHEPPAHEFPSESDAVVLGTPEPRRAAWEDPDLQGLASDPGAPWEEPEAIAVPDWPEPSQDPELPAAAAPAGAGEDPLLAAILAASAEEAPDASPDPTPSEALPVPESPVDPTLRALLADLVREEVRRELALLREEVRQELRAELEA